MELNTNSENMLRVKPLGELTKKKKKKKANTIIPIEIPAPMYGKQKNRKYRCFVKDCPNQATTRDAKLYPMPKDDAVKREWMKICGMPGKAQDISESTFVCKIHFVQEDLHSFKCKQIMSFGNPCICFKFRLVPDGVRPTLYLPSEGQKFFDTLHARDKRVEARERKKMVKELLGKPDNGQVSESNYLLPNCLVEEQFDLSDIRQYLPEEFVDRSWLVLPEDNSNLQIYSDPEENEKNTNICVKQEQGVVADPNIFFLGDQCRICAEKCKDEVPIFGDTDYGQMINECMPIKVSKDDNLPLKVCRHCLKQVKKMHALLNKCRAADDILRGHLAKHIEFESLAVEENTETPMVSVETTVSNIENEEDFLLNGVTFLDTSTAATPLVDLTNSTHEKALPDNYCPSQSKLPSAPIVSSPSTNSVDFEEIPNPSSEIEKQTVQDANLNLQRFPSNSSSKTNKLNSETDENFERAQMTLSNLPKELNNIIRDAISQKISQPLLFVPKDSSSNEVFLLVPEDDSIKILCAPKQVITASKEKAGKWAKSDEQPAAKRSKIYSLAEI